MEFILDSLVEKVANNYDGIGQKALILLVHSRKNCRLKWEVSFELQPY